jgi:hypothetical protein
VSSLKNPEPEPRADACVLTIQLPAEAVDHDLLGSKEVPESHILLRQSIQNRECQGFAVTGVPQKRGRAVNPASAVFDSGTTSPCRPESLLPGTPGLTGSPNSSQPETESNEGLVRQRRLVSVTMRTPCFTRKPRSPMISASCAWSTANDTSHSRPRRTIGLHHNPALRQAQSIIFAYSATALHQSGL